MADSPAPRPPVPRLDRASLERVLARAAELQGTSGDGDATEQFSEDQLIELGKEVGLSAQNLRQALAEERTRSILPDEERGLAAGLFGPSRVRASRTVPGKPADVLAAVDAWMQRQELLIVKRHHADRIVWEPRRDFVVGIKRALRAGGRDYALSRATEVSATVMAVDDQRVHVLLDGDFGERRSRAAQQAGATAGLGAVAIGTLLFINVPILLVAAPVVVVAGAGYGTARGMHRRIVARAQLALEQLLDRLEREDVTRRGPDSLLGALVAAATSLPPRRF